MTEKQVVCCGLRTYDRSGVKFDGLRVGGQAGHGVVVGGKGLGAVAGHSILNNMAYKINIKNV